MESAGLRTSVRPSPLYEQVYQSIKDLIGSGGLRLGEPVSEAQLAEMLKVSRTPVREAVRRLVSEHLLVLPERGGIRVYAPTPADLADVYYTRAVLEGAAARLAAMRIDGEFIARLEALCEQCRPAVEANAVDEAAKLNGQFHWEIVRRANNARIAGQLTSLDPVVVRYRHLSLSFREHLTQGLADHQRMIDLFRQGDPSRTEVFVREHIIRSGGRIVRAMMHVERGIDVTPTPAMQLLLEA